MLVCSSLFLHNVYMIMILII